MWFFLSELEQSVEMSRKDCQLQREENLCRQKELKQVKNRDSGLRFAPGRAACVTCLTSLRFVNVQRVLWMNQHVFWLSLLL